MRLSRIDLSTFQQVFWGFIQYRGKGMYVYIYIFQDVDKNANICNIYRIHVYTYISPTGESLFVIQC